ncbi:MAG: FkbM family methyltransferase [Candidatus Binataceae bacterium]
MQVADADQKGLLRSFLHKRGYVLWKRDYFRFGISPFVDMARLNRAWGRSFDVLFDVGANVGQFAGEARRELPHTAIHCFEPHPRSFEKLSQSGTDDRMYLHCLALSDKAGEVTFYEYAAEGEGTHINSLVPNARFPTRFGYQSRKTTVLSSTLDEFCSSQDVDRIDFLKIDVEGAELSVLRGGANILSRGKILAVYLEFNDLEPAPGAGGGSLMPIARYLDEYGMRYACTYTDFLLHDDQLHVVANALFVLPPGK